MDLEANVAEQKLTQLISGHTRAAPSRYVIEELLHEVGNLTRRYIPHDRRHRVSPRRRNDDHDFDEAIRLADRIAIMNGGEIIQTGTPEELVLNPATDYVAEFTRGIPRAKVLSAGAIMGPVSGNRVAGQIAVATKIGDLAADIVNTDAPFAIIDGDGVIVGEVNRDAVLDAG